MAKHKPRSAQILRSAGLLLDAGHTPAAIAKRLAADYGISREQAEDLVALAKRKRQLRLHVAASLPAHPPSRWPRRKRESP